MKEYYISISHIIEGTDYEKLYWGKSFNSFEFPQIMDGVLRDIIRKLHFEYIEAILEEKKEGYKRTIEKAKLAMESLDLIKTYSFESYKTILPILIRTGALCNKKIKIRKIIPLKLALAYTNTDYIEDKKVSDLIVLKDDENDNYFMISPRNNNKKHIIEGQGRLKKISNEILFKDYDLGLLYLTDTIVSDCCNIGKFPKEYIYYI